MTKKLLAKATGRRALFGILVMLASAGLSLTACTSNDDNAITPGYSQEPVLTPGALDVVNGRLYKVIRVDSLDRYCLPVSALTDVDVNVTHASEYFGAQLETAADGQKYVTLYQKKTMTNRVGAWGLVPHATSHTTVRAVRHTAVPLSIVPSCLIEVHIIFRKRGVSRLSETLIRHRLM